MLSVSESYLSAINADTRNMPYRVKLAGTVMLDQTQVPKMRLSESVSDSSGLSLGTSNSATLSLTLRDAEAIDYTNVLVEPEVGLTLPDGTVEWLPLGKFWVTNSSTSNDYKTVDLTCSDGMYLLSGKYVSTITYPATIEAVVKEITAKAGVIFVAPAEWPNVTIRKRPEDLTYREAVGYVAGCMGCNARFNRNGALEFVWYTDTGITIRRKTQYLNGMVKLNHKPLNVKFEVSGPKETYEITVNSDGNGGVSATPGSRVIEGETVVLSINPFDGYELAEISAVAENGNPDGSEREVTLYMSSEGGRTFVQPDSNVIVTASFRETNASSFALTTRAFDGGSIRASGTSFNEGDSVTIYVEANDGFEIDKFVTTPANLGLTQSGTNSSGETLYTFTMPKSDVTINAYFKAEATYYNINPSVEYGGAMLILDSNGDYVSEAEEGTTISVNVSPSGGYVFDGFDSDVVLTQVEKNKYKFVMPARDVSIKACFKFSEDESKVGTYSWLQRPQSAPTTKPYWAVFYNEDDRLPTCQKYYLVWFDSWSATGYTTEGDYREYKIQFNGYYYCGSKNNGHGDHEWDASTWRGNGATGSSLEWRAYIGRMYANWSDYYGPSEQYCLIASNVHLFYNNALIFENCDTAIAETQTGYLKDGMDVRESGSLTQWLCPDTFSTPAPASNWMVLMPESGLYMTVGADGKYDTPLTSYPKSLIAFYYDSISIQKIGAIFSDTDEELYIASFTNARWTYLRDSTLGWDEEIHDLPEGAVVGFRSPLVSTAAADGSLDGSLYNFAGVLATSQTLYDTSGNVFMYKNSCRICSCASAAAEVSTFSLMRSVASSGDSIVIEAEDISVSTENDTLYITSASISAEASGDTIELTISETPDAPTDAINVTMAYTNPLIYESMVEDISPLVKGITYTPAKVKHRGNPAFQAGDIVTVPDGKGVSHTVLIMQQTMNFGGGMNSEITCPGKTEGVSSFASNGPVTTQIKREVQQSNAEFERRMSANNALVFASIYKTISTSEAKISSIVEWQTEKSATIAETAQIASANKATIASLTEWKGTTNTTIAQIQQTVSETEATVEAQAEILTETAHSLAELNARVDENGASIGLLVENNEVKGSILIEAINGESSAKISADRLDIVGKKLNIKVDATNIEGEITAKQINTTGLIAENISATTLTGKTLKGCTIILNGYMDVQYQSVDYGHIGYTTGKSEVALTEGVGLYNKDYNTRCFVTNSGGAAIESVYSSYLSKIYTDAARGGTSANILCKNSSGQSMITVLPASVYIDSSSFSHSVANCCSSDASVKSDINHNLDRYEMMYDQLSPCMFKYTYGTSSRYHTGFIAQEVKAAIEDNGLSTKDFAAYVEFAEDENQKYGTCGLRYSEFIALNTWQIQKLKARIAELEKKLGGQTNE